MARRKNPLDGRTAVITGAASGIGRALAVRLAGQGCPVAIADADAEGLALTESTISGPVFSRELDVRDRQSFMGFAAGVADWAPAAIGAVINNAGVTTSQSFANASSEDDEWVLEVNFGGVVNGSHAFLPLLIKQDSGTLVNVSSIFGLHGFPFQSAYSASKHAVRGFTESLRHEMRGTGVNIAVVHPGGVKTNIVENARFHQDEAGNVNIGAAAERFASVAKTTPEKAAAIIQSGIEREDPRIRVGADAVVADLLVRVAPVRYYSIMERLLPVLDRSRSR